MRTIVDGIEKVVVVSDDLREYQFTDIDDSTATLYVSFVNAKGAYYFKKLNDVSCRFFRNTGNYDSDWTNRATRTYSIFNEVF